MNSIITIEKQEIEKIKIPKVKKIKKSYKDLMIDYFKKHVGDDFGMIDIITKSLILSLVPLHEDTNKIKRYIKLTKSNK